MPCFASLFILTGGKRTALIKSVPLKPCRKSDLTSLWRTINSQRHLYCNGEVWRYHSTWCSYTSFFSTKTCLSWKSCNHPAPSLFSLLSFFPFKGPVSAAISKPYSSLSLDLSQEQKKVRGLTMKTFCRNGALVIILESSPDLWQNDKRNKRTTYRSWGGRARGDILGCSRGEHF